MFAIAGVITALLAVVSGLVMGWVDPWPNRHNHRLYLLSSSIVLTGLLGTLWVWLVTREMTGVIRFLAAWFVLSCISGVAHGVALTLAPRIRHAYHWYSDDKVEENPPPKKS